MHLKFSIPKNSHIASIYLAPISSGESEYIPPLVVMYTSLSALQVPKQPFSLQPNVIPSTHKFSI